MRRKRESDDYALIYFMSKKPIKRAYDTATEAFGDYKARGCVFVELYNKKGSRLVSIKLSNEEISLKGSVTIAKKKGYLPEYF